MAPHCVRPEGHAHDPAWHTSPDGQTVSHPPQCSGSAAMFTQTPPQSICSGPQVSTTSIPTSGASLLTSVGASRGVSVAVSRGVSTEASRAMSVATSSEPTLSSVDASTEPWLPSLRGMVSSSSEHPEQSTATKHATVKRSMHRA